MCAVDYVDGGVAGYGLCPGEKSVTVAWRCGLGSRIKNTRRTACVDGQDLVLAGLDIPQRDQFDQLVPLLAGHVMVLGEVLSHVI